MLDEEKDSPFHGRIQTADVAKDTVRCISLTSLYRTIEKQGFFIAKEAKGQVIEGGIFWRGTNEETLIRTVFILK